jgi:hypothetical protein
MKINHIFSNSIPHHDSVESYPSLPNFPFCSGLGLELAQSRYARRNEARKPLLGELAS